MSHLSFLIYVNRGLSIILVILIIARTNFFFTDCLYCFFVCLFSISWIPTLIFIIFYLLLTLDLICSFFWTTLLRYGWHTKSCTYWKYTTWWIWISTCSRNYHHDLCCNTSFTSKSSLLPSFFLSYYYCVVRTLNVKSTLLENF